MLPKDKEKAKAFDEETQRIREQLTKMADTLPDDLAKKLRTASDEFCTPSAAIAVTPGTEEVDGLIRRAVDEGEDSLAYMAATTKIANDLFVGPPFRQFSFGKPPRHPPL